MKALNKNEITSLPKEKIIKQNKFWNEFFFRIGNGESLRGVSNDTGVHFQTVW